MSNKPKGAMGSPYVNNGDGTSIGNLMGDAFDKLHENSWDGGKKNKDHQKIVDKINEDIDKKLKSENVEKNDLNEDEELEGIEEVKNTKKTSKKVSKKETSLLDNIEEVLDNEDVKKFQPGIKKDILKIIIDTDYEIVKASDTEIIISDENNNKFKFLPL